MRGFLKLSLIDGTNGILIPSLNLSELIHQTVVPFMLSSQLWTDEELMHEELAQAVDRVLAFSGGDITRGMS
jgi:hypothetical protein